MRIFKRILPFAAGILFFLILNAALNYMLIPYQFTRVKVHKIETETFDDLVLGSSHGGAAFDPAVMTEVTGASAFNACAGGQFPMDNYYLLRDALREHAPERVVLEYDPNYWIAKDGFNRTARYQESVMAFSAVRASYFRKLLMPGDIRFVLMPWSLYENGLSDAPRIMATKRSDAYRNYGVEPFGEDNGQACEENGFLRIPDKAGGDRTIPELTYNEGMESIVAENRSWFEKMIRLCRDRGIEVVVVTTPVPPSTLDANREFYEIGHAWMTDLQDQYGFAYLDYVLGPESTALVFTEEDFSDAEGHMRESAARRFTENMAGNL